LNAQKTRDRYTNQRDSIDARQLDLKEKIIPPSFTRHRQMRKAGLFSKSRDVQPGRYSKSKDY